MNTAFLDAQNLAWKIHAVEGGLADRSILETYESEQARWSRRRCSTLITNMPGCFRSVPPAASTVKQQPRRARRMDTRDNDFIKTFKESCEFTLSATASAYKPNALNWSPEHPAQSHVAHPRGTKLRTGRLLVNADVTRVVDANVVHLEQEVPLNGSFRIFVFAGKPRRSNSDVSSQRPGPRRLSATWRANMARTRLLLQRLPPSRRGQGLAPRAPQPAQPLLHRVHRLRGPPQPRSTSTRDLPPLLARYREHVYADDRWDRRVPDARRRPRTPRWGWTRNVAASWSCAPGWVRRHDRSPRGGQRHGRCYKRVLWRVLVPETRRRSGEGVITPRRNIEGREKRSSGDGAQRREEQHKWSEFVVYTMILGRKYIRIIELLIHQKELHTSSRTMDTTVYLG